MEGGRVSTTTLLATTTTTASCGTLCSLYQHLKYTPMDNECNDFQGRNLHLVGEENSKVSSVLHPYSLPKFDFDDSLHGHLRFDVLVENEVFLGIPSHEDNHWIEEFSRGSSGIGFRTSAAESCSIPRNNNVWSEATSSESVEMLLKSVGQEEMVPGESSLEKSNACDELGSLAKQMELNLKQDEKRDYQESDQASQAVELLENISGPNQSSEGVNIDFKCTSETQEIEQSSFECSGANIDEASLVLTENSGDVERDDKNQTKADSPGNECLNNRMQETLIITETQSNTDCSSLNMVIDVENSSCQDKYSAKNLESATNQSLKSFECVEGQSAGKNNSSVNDENLSRRLAEIHASDYDSPLHVASEMEGSQNFKESSSYPEREGSALGDTPDLHTVVETSQNSILLVVAENVEGKEHCTDKYEKSSGASQGDGGIDRRANVTIEVEAHGANADCDLQGLLLQMSNGQRSSAEMKETHLESHSATDGGSSGTTSEVYMSRVDYELHKQVNEDSMNNTDGIPSLMNAASSAEFGSEKLVIDNPKENNDGNGLQDEAVLPSILAGILLPVKSSSEEKTDIDNRYHHISVCAEEDLRHVDSESVGLDNDVKRLPSSSLDEEVKEKLEVAHGVERGSPSVNESASDAGYATNIASHETSDNITSLHVGGAPADAVADLDEELKSPSDGVSIDIDRKEELEVEVLPEANMPNLKELSPISEAEKTVPGEVTIEVVIRAAQSVPATETFDRASKDNGVIVNPETSKEHPERVQVDPVPCGSRLGEADAEALTAERHLDERVIVDLETSRLCSDKMQVDPVPCGSTLGDAEDAEAICVERNQETNIENNHGVEYSEISGGGCLAETDKPSHDSTDVVSRVVFPETEKREQEGPMESAIENVTPSGRLGEIGCKAVSTLENAECSGAFGEERSFTFDVSPLAGLSEGGTCVGWQSFPNIKACKMSTTEKGTASTSCGHKDHNPVQQPKTTIQVPESGNLSGGPRSTSERKTRRGSGKSGKDNAKKGKNVKGLTSGGQSEREDKPCVSGRSSRSAQLVQLEVGNTGQSGTKPTPSLPIPTSNLPNLNASVPTSVPFHQPFTDVQQMQLRAQIFVYGSLIQGAAPDEACMISAFGTSDGRKSVWEPSWRACVERLHGQKSIASNRDTPMQSHSGFKAQDPSIKPGLPQSKVLPSAASRLSSNDTHSAAVHPMIPLSSPLWNISTPSCDGRPSGNNYQALPPLHPYQTPPTRAFGGHTTPWLSQAPFPGRWVASPQSSAVDFNAHLSSLPTTETVKLTPVKDTSIAISSGNNPLAHGGGSSFLAGTSPMFVGKKMIGSSIQHPTDSKSRKRKKNNISKDLLQIPLAAAVTGSMSSAVVSSHSSKKGPSIEDCSPISLLAPNQTELVSTPAIGSHFSTSVAVTASPSFVSKSSSDKFPVVASPALSIDHSKRGDSDKEKSAVSAEDFSSVEEAKQQAEVAVADAASAIGHCRSLWTRLDNQRNSGLMSEIEANLSSAAATIAAAASVAKAAAAAARIASNAALQAKHMADEAVTSSASDIPLKKSAVSISNDMNNMGTATPASILKGGDGNCGCNLIILAAREAARRRIEAASSASRHAENLDAIVRAAELAAEAVSQAGVFVAMGNPFPLSVLVEAGPDSLRNTESFKEVPKQSKGLSGQEMSTTTRTRPSVSREISRNVDGKEGTSSVGGGKQDVGGQRGRRASTLAKAITSIPESENSSVQDAHENDAQMLKVNGIKEGCLVEVFKNGGNFKGAWYSADVLSLNDGKAFVCYTELQSDEGPGLLREWVPLEGEGNEVPLVRNPHPMSSIRFEGTRKRRRTALKNYNWCVGDRVDAWIEDCWCEGVITEKNENDETTLTVHFPAQGQTSVVRAWQLRPSLVWKNGEWIELPTSRQNASSEGDTPLDKRQKQETCPFVESGKETEPVLLPLSSSEKVFNIGSNRDENKADVPRTMRSGLRKEGSKVIFGVPKPGKKRKFMEVSKHYVSEGCTKNNVSGEPGKLPKYLMPQGSGSCGWNHSSKTDTKEKQAAESKSKASNFGKLPGVSSRTLPQKENPTLLVSAPLETNIRSLTVKNSISNDKNETDQPGLIGFGPISNSEKAVEYTMSSQAFPSDRAKKGSMSAKSQQLNKGKLAPAGRKPTKFEVKGEQIPGAADARRSNRRIQPTSRLLEGLQSSLIVSKIPSVSHDKSHRSHNKGASRGTNNHG